MKSGQAIKLGSQAYEPAVVVTGASVGIGRAFAELLIDKEFTPLLISRDAGTLDSLAAGAIRPTTVGPDRPRLRSTSHSQMRHRRSKPIFTSIISTPMFLSTTPGLIRAAIELRLPDAKLDPRCRPGISIPYADALLGLKKILRFIVSFRHGGLRAAGDVWKIRRRRIGRSAKLHTLGDSPT